MAGLYNDNGTVNLPAVLGVMGLAKLAQGAMRQHDINAAIDLENQGLPQGYQLPHQKGYFNWNDPATQQKAIQDLAKNQMTKYNSADARNGMTQQGYAVPFNAPANINTQMEKVYYPTEAKRGEYRAQQAAGGAEFQNGLQALQLARQAMGGQQQPQGSPNLPPMNYGQTPPMQVDANGTPVLTGGAQMSGMPQGPTYDPLPQMQGGNLPMSPEMARGIMTTASQLRGQDQTAQTAANRLQFDRNKWDQGVPQRQAQLQKVIADTKRVGEETKWIGPKAKAYIRNLGKQTDHSTSQIDAMLASGHTLKEIGDAMLRKLKMEGGLDPDEGSSGGSNKNPQAEADNYLGDN